MAFYSFIRTKGAYGHGVADITDDNTGNWQYKELGTVDGITYIQSDDTNVPTQPKDIEFKAVDTLPDEIQAIVDIATIEQEAKATEQRISEIKEELLTAVLLDDTEALEALKTEYKVLMSEE